MVVSNPIGIVTIANDLHGQFIATKLKDRFDQLALLFETDTLLHAAPIFQVKNGAAFAGTNDHFDRHHDVTALKLIWWRRFAAEQKDSEHLEDDHRLLSKVSFSSLYRGMFACAPMTKFVSDPQSTSMASNKIFQLNNACRFFENVPDTAATNSLVAAKELFGSSQDVIFKPIDNALNKIVFTVRGRTSDLNEKQLSDCPAIIQQRVAAKHHLRVNVFGTRSSWFSIKSSELDWRKDLANCEVAEVEVDSTIETQCIDFLNSLDLCMGIFDFIVDQNDQLFFIEVNPQGQFLFLQPFAKHDISEMFCEFLISQ